MELDMIEIGLPYAATNNRIKQLKSDKHLIAKYEMLRDRLAAEMEAHGRIVLLGLSRCLNPSS